MQICISYANVCVLKATLTKADCYDTARVDVPRDLPNPLRFAGLCISLIHTCAPNK